MSMPLFERFPGLAELPRVQLCDLPTPLDDARDLLPPDTDSGPSGSGGGLWVKRDDLTNAVYGGNKVRKLEFLLGEALDAGCRSVITFGAYGSNHALATAVHARALGLEPHVVLSPQAPGPFAAATLRAHAALGTVIHPIDGWDGRREAVRAMRELGERDGVEPLVIPMGGTSAAGAVGYVNAAFELAEQVSPSALITSPAVDDVAWPDVVYVAGGTLGTAIGLAIGFAALERAGVRPAPRVEAIRVTPGEVANIGFAQRLVAETVALLRTHEQAFPAFTLADLRFELRDEFFDPGYGVVTPQTTAAVGRAADAGVELETTYTGKALVALIADSASKRLGANEHVLFWDTYHSGEMPPPGSADALPDPLPAYIAECDRLFANP